MSDINNAFIKYDKTTGLKIKNKAEINADLTTFFQTAYGGDLVIQEGTEVYTFIDVLSTGISNMSTAIKGVWDAFSFIGASGASLDILCNAFGISRNEGETDEQLRSRYYISMFAKSVGTMDGLKAQIMKLSSMIDDTNTRDCFVKEVAVTEYLADTQTPIILDEVPSTATTSNFPAHSITPVIKLYERTDSGEVPVTDFASTVSVAKVIQDTVQNYKSLGCLCNGLSDIQDQISGATDFNKFYYAVQYPVYIEITLSWVNAGDQNTYETLLHEYIKQRVYNYVSSLGINTPITVNGLQACVFAANVDLTNQPLVTVSSLKYKKQSGSYTTISGGMIPIGLLNYMYMEDEDNVEVVSA